MSRIHSTPEPRRISQPQIYVGVAFTTMATLILELSLTRIYSVVFFYHFAFLAISVALFGLGAGGVFSYVAASWRGELYAKLGHLAALNSVAVLISLMFLLSQSEPPHGFGLGLIYFMSAIPFFFAGATVSLAISDNIQRVHKVYFFDLLGASGGCLLLVPLLNAFGGPNTVLCAAVMLAASAAIWYNVAHSTTGRVLAVALALCFALLIAYNGKEHVIDIRYAKGQKLPPELFEAWNSLSRVGVVRDPESQRLNIVIDADAATAIPNFDTRYVDDRLRKILLADGIGFAYQIRPGAKALIIGPGGGWDVARALASGSQDITAVEINPLIATKVMRQTFRDQSHWIYFRPEVHIHIEDGRSFVRRSDQKYQVLQATLVDTWASTAAGAFALSENNLYTTDAFEDYLRHLTDDGLVVITRWGFEPPRESLRLVSLAMASLAKLGEKDASRHVAVIRENAQNVKGWGAQDTVMIFRKPIGAGDLAAIRAGVERNDHLQLVYLPDGGMNNPFSQLLLSPDPAQFWRTYAFDVSPVDDDRPFFFYTVQPRDLFSYALHFVDTAADAKVNLALPLLFGLLGISIVATLVVLALPPLLLGARLPAERGVRTFLSYFILIGVAYILIQIALIQKFVLFLSQPVYALTVVVFSMLISSGIGSAFSKRLTAGFQQGRMRWVLVGVAAGVALLAVLVAPVCEVAVGLPLPMKALISVLMVAPVGFLMGMPFPAGLTRLEETYPQAVRWAWSLNAAASVMGSATAIFLAIYIGLRGTLLVGGLLYVGALLVFRLKSNASQSVPNAVEVPVG